MNIGVLIFVLLAHLLGVAWSANNYNHCTQYAEYKTLANLRQKDTCMNVDSVFKLLAEITLKEHFGGCRAHIISLLADHFGYKPSTPHKCQCQGTNRLQEYHTGSGDGVTELKHLCLNQQPYRDMYYQFFSDSHHSTGHIMACRTHHSVWSALRRISTTAHGSNSCQKDIIFHLKYAFEHHGDSCRCTEYTPTTTRRTTAAPTTTTLTTTVPTTTTRRTTATPSTTTSTTTKPTTTTRRTTAAPSTTTSTTTIPTTTTIRTTAAPTTTTSTTAAPQTTAAPTTTVPTTAKLTQSTSQPKKFSCNELAVVQKIAQDEKARHPDASPCDPNADVSDDAYVLSACNMTSPMTWRKGPNVMADCKSNTHLIPGFTPISTFSRQSYSSIGAQAGIFLECYNTGFKMAVQKCNGVPEIVHIENGGVFTHDPSNYYVIV